jgi:hypothetical protein
MTETRLFSQDMDEVDDRARFDPVRQKLLLWRCSMQPACHDKAQGASRSMCQESSSVRW